MNFNQLKNKLKQENHQKNEKNIIKQNIDHQENQQKNPFKVIKDIEEYKVKGLDSIYYISDFIKQQGSENILQQIECDQKLLWNQLKSGAVTKEGLVTNNEPTIDSYVKDLLKEIQNQGILNRANHILVNEYIDGIGIMPHTDGPLYFPHVAILSLGSGAIFNFYKDYLQYKENNKTVSLLIEPNSLLVFKDQAYHDYLHSIEDNRIDTLFIQIQKQKESYQDFQVVNSNIDNLEQVNLYKKLNEQSFEQLQEKYGNKQEKNNEDQCLIEINQKRNKRISLTIRYVDEAKQ